MRTRPSLRRFTSAAVVFALCLAGGCGDEAAPPIAAKQGGAGLTIGFLYVGSINDLGYNQAAFDGSQAVARAFPRATLIQRQHVPETPAAERVMQDMIDRGATIIFATSFGHLAPALSVAAGNPDVTFLHQGGLQTAANLGTYFGTIWEAQYLAGQAAGLATRTGTLGFVAAFPIAQSLLTINAWHLGARSVRPHVRTRVRFTGSWCDPKAQRAAARALLRAKADVLGQHQDCTRTVIEEAAAAHRMTTGYHYDAESVAPRAWLTGSAWNWGPLYVRMVKSVLTGRFATSPYASRYRVGLRDGAVVLAPFGRAAGPALRRRVLATRAGMLSGRIQPFAGPVRDQRGRVRIPAGRQPGIDDLEETDYLAQGVIGHLGRP